MTEQFDPAEVRSVAAALREFERRCVAILELLGEKHSLSQSERQEATRLYTLLKSDLKDAAKHGTLSGRREARSRVEECFFDPAVRRAHIDLRPATNSHPVSSRWFAAVFEARSEFSYWLHNMAGLPGLED